MDGILEETPIQLLSEQATVIFETDDIDEEISYVEDEADRDATIVPERYDITSFGADFDVEGLVKRIKRGDILVPEFQRGYVWNIHMASRFIESLLLGLPVPGIFLARESGTNRMVVIDGLQRLKTLQYFYEGLYYRNLDRSKPKAFELTRVQPEFEGRSYDTLDEYDRIRLNDSIIHATIVKQESPDEGNTTIYHLFERLNNGGLKLAPQEIRTAVYYGNLMDLIKKLNEYDNWRSVFGEKNRRLKDEELILRFLALYYNLGKYQEPMRNFLNRFAKSHIDADSQFLNDAETLFKNTIDTLMSSLGKRAFRPERSLNAAVFDSVMFGISRTLKGRASDKYSEIATAYDTLLLDKEYMELVSHSTSDGNNVRQRLKKTETAFAEI